MTGDRSRLMNFVKKFIGTVRFGNDHFGAIMGYGDYVIGDSVISRVYYVEGLGHNLFSVGQFCDSDLEVAFRKHSCYVRDTEGVELLKGSRGSNLYTITVDRHAWKSSPDCLISQSPKNNHGYWHLAFKPPTELRKEHTQDTHKPKTENTNLEVLNTLHMDLCGPMRVQMINGKKYILVIVDDYSRFTWVKFLRSKDETPAVVGIFHQKTVPRTPQQNGVVERRNRTLVEAARTMLIFSKARVSSGPKLWATVCFHPKTVPYSHRHSEITIELFQVPAPIMLTHGPISSRARTLIQALCYTYCTPTNKRMEMLFQPMFDEYFNPPSIHQNPIPVIPTAGEPSAEVNPFAAADPDPFVNEFAPDNNSDASSSGEINIPESSQSTQHHEHVRKWTDSHPIDNIIGEPFKDRLNGSFGTLQDPSLWVIGIRKTSMATAYADADHAGADKRTRFEFILPRLGMEVLKPEDTQKSSGMGSGCVNGMTSLSMANAEQAPARASPVRTDEQIVPRNQWVPIGKSNCYLNEEKSQRNPIFKIAVDILKQTNFFRAFTASSTIPAIYIQQFWDTIRFDNALQITPVDNNRAFSSPPTPDTLVEFVNELGYPKEVVHLSNVTTNDMFQPWRALATIINLCLTGKTSGFERPRAPALQILWGIVNRAHIDYAERMWEEFTQSIHTFTEDKRKLAQHTLGKKKATLILIPSIRFTKLIIFHLQRLHNFHPRPDSPLHLPTEEPVLGHLKFSAKGSKREVFGMTIPNELINNVIRGADYYDAYLEKVAKHQRYIAGEELSDPESPAPKPAKPTKQAKPKATEQPTISKTKAKKSKHAPAKPKEKKRKPVSESSEAQPLAKRAKAGKVVKKRTVKSSKQLVDEFVDEGVPAAKPSLEDTEEAILQKVLEESLTDAYPTQRGPLPPVVFRETDTGKFQPLPEVPGKGKEKVGEEQAAQVLLNLQTPKKKSSAEQYILQRRSHIPTTTAGREDSTSLYAELGLYGSDTESDEEMPSVGRSGTQDEGQAGSDPGTLAEGQAGSDPGTPDEGQAGPNPDDVAESLPLPTLGVLAGPNLKPSDVEITDPSSQPQPEHMDEGFTASAYPDVQENLKLIVVEQMIPEEPVSSTWTLSSLQHLAKDFSFGDQFLNDQPSEADNEKTTADTEAESMVSVTIQQDISIIPPMTSPVIDLVSRPDSPNVHWPLPTTTTTTAAPTTTITKTLPLPPQPQQGSSDPILIKRMGELEQHIANLAEENQALETKLDK
ncbi:monodehydroascorbate reductase [Tanacetum coccineum]